MAGLCNYQTFMLYLMPHLSSLDTLLLAAETKAAACATFTKKQLYYNMRIRTMRRAAAGLLRQAKAGCQVGRSSCQLVCWKQTLGSWCLHASYNHCGYAEALKTWCAAAGGWQQVGVAAV